MIGSLSQKSSHHNSILASITTPPHRLSPPEVVFLCEAPVYKGLRQWPGERIHRLVELWADSTKSVAAIARELGVDCRTVIRRAEYLALRRRTDSKTGAN